MDKKRKRVFSNSPCRKEKRLSRSKSKKRKRSRTYSSTDSSSDSSSPARQRNRSKERREKKTKDKTKKAKMKRRRSSSESPTIRKKKKKGKKKKKKKKKKTEKDKPPETDNSCVLGTTGNAQLKKKLDVDKPDIGPAPRILKPMTKEEWDKQQSIVRRVYDEESNRHRLVKGDGEIIEEIVSKDRHDAINKQATRGDGTYYQTQLGLLK